MVSKYLLSNYNNTDNNNEDQFKTYLETHLSSTLGETKTRTASRWQTTNNNPLGQIKLSRQSETRNSQ
jgi:hypothetical protein